MIPYGSNTSSQHNQSGLTDELLALLTNHFPSCGGFSPSQTATAAHIVFENGLIGLLGREPCRTVFFFRIGWLAFGALLRLED
ncbi:hypothetical protein TNCV_2820561 [Trichonephila clavipes]|nr:hypothetical protein TNCV_2820561 [Trichonephila clavipes]